MGPPSIPQTMRQWNVVGNSGIEPLLMSEQPVPELGDSDVLVRSMFIHFQFSTHSL